MWHNRLSAVVSKVAWKWYTQITTGYVGLAQESKIKQGNLATVSLSCYQLVLGPDTSTTGLFHKPHRELLTIFLDAAIA